MFSHADSDDWLDSVYAKDDLRHHWHYENMSMQYAAISKSGKNDDFLDEKFWYFFLIFAQNIDRGYTLEPPH